MLKHKISQLSEEEKQSLSSRNFSGKALTLLRSELKRLDLTAQYIYWLQSNVYFIDQIAYATSKQFCDDIEDTINNKKTLVNNVPKYIESEANE